MDSKLLENLIDVENLSRTIYRLLDESTTKKNIQKINEADSLSKILKEKIDSFDAQFRKFYSESGI